MIKLYGIPNCQTVKKAQTWLNEQNIEFEFVNFKKDAPTEQLVQKWLTEVPLSTLVNKKGTTWRKLDAQEQSQLENEQSAIALICTHPSIIKRPILEKDNKVVQVGFTDELYQQIFH
ncbi:Spx/MgsR family RNA polymerase-binding regulatory protein [Neisseria sp. Ec49-e6-T10]|uniref:Spx/MgsR family RNA polymerase-binding regulatory protein n=1 Tax=Neisseria sp. Ec49-e6-T10 TaxID=3140744 RepID=UPI003EBEF7DB